MLKKILLSILLATLTGLSASLYFFAQPTFHGTHTSGASEKPHIVLECLASGMGGREEHVAKLASLLSTNNYPLSVITEHNSALHKHLSERNIPHYTTHSTLFLNYLRPLHHYILGTCLEKIHRQHPINYIHCNDPVELTSAKKFAHKHPARVILTRHVPDPISHKYIRNIYALVGCSPAIGNFFAQENNNKKLGITHVTSITELFDETRCLTYTPAENRYDFFSSEHNIPIANSPIITMIANFYADPKHKNHALLIQALDELVNVQHYDLQVMLAGDGPTRPMIETMVRERHLEKHVHFLGYIKSIPALLFHSDIMVLTSKREALGIVYLEAGLLKKAAIGAYQTGAEVIIQHEQTGLLFNNDDKDDLVRCIKELLDNPKRAKKMGERAYDRVMQHFHPDIIFSKYEELYSQNN